MVESPELVVNADLDKPLQGAESFLLHCNMIPIIELIPQMSTIFVHCNNSVFGDSNQRLTNLPTSLAQGAFCDAAASRSPQFRAADEPRPPAPFSSRRGPESAG
jgi:hypothetical protein